MEEPLDLTNYSFREQCRQQTHVDCIPCCFFPANQIKPLPVLDIPPPSASDVMEANIKVSMIQSHKMQHVEEDGDW